MDKWNNKPVYLCDPKKNASCSKEICYISGGICRHTFNKAYEKKQTNQDKLAEMVRTMDPYKLASIMEDITVCDNANGFQCPASDYCKTRTEGCCDILEEWLKEDNDD